MKFLPCITILFLLTASPFAFAQNTEIETTLLKRGEVFFSFAKEDLTNPNVLARMLSVDKVENGRVYAYANQTEWQNFTALQIPWRKELSPGEMGLLNPGLFKNGNAKGTWSTYPSYSQYDSIMQAFASDYPGLCKLHTLETLSSGRKIFALELSNNVDSNETEAQFLYSSTMHGDETTGWILLMRLAEHLLQNYGSDSLATHLMNNLEIWICPNTNPDGTYAAGNNNPFGATRYNGSHIDLNRNYPDPEDGIHPDGNAYQPETQAMMNFADSMNFTMAANLHGGYEVLNYPWDTWSQLPADVNWWLYVCHMYADTAHANAPSGYLMGQGNGITNGYAWYTVSGGRQDYMNYWHQCREMVIELSNTKLLPENQLNAHWDYNKTSLLRYMEQCTFGLTGMVSDSLTNAPLAARIEISGHDIDSSHVYAHAARGDYYRLLDDGSYNITFSHPGYHSKTIQSVNVSNTSLSTLNVQLVKDTTNSIHEWVDDLSVKLFPNPADDYIELAWSVRNTHNLTSIELFSVDGKKVMAFQLKNVDHHTMDVSLLKSGTYLIRVRNGKHMWKGNLQKR